LATPTMTAIKQWLIPEKIFASLNQAVPLLIGIFLFFNPIPYATTIEEVSFYLCVAIVLCLIYFKKADFSFRSPLSLPFALFVIWSFLGLFPAFNKMSSINDFYAHLLKYLIYYFILVNFIKSRKHMIILTWIIMISTALFYIGVLYYYYVIFGAPLSQRLGLDMVELQTNLMGVVCLFAMVLALNHLSLKPELPARIILAFCLFWCTLTVLMTQTRSSLLGMMLASLILFAQNKKVIVSLLVIFVLLITLTPLKNRFSVETVLKNERIDINLASLELIKDYPLFGIGFSMETYQDRNFMKPYYDRVRRAKSEPPSGGFHIYQNPHNILLDVAVRTGLIGFCLFCFIIFRFLRMGWTVVRQGMDPNIRNWGLCLMAAFAGYFTQGMFEPALHGSSAIVLYTILGMMTILWRQHETDHQQAGKSAAGDRGAA
jgi:O-antigen ligase